MPEYEYVLQLKFTAESAADAQHVAVEMESELNALDGLVKRVISNELFVGVGND
jgi:hypothetical protein